MAKSRGRNYTPGERAIMVLGVTTGQSCTEINRVLMLDAVKGGREFRKMPVATYADLTRGIYVHLLAADTSYRWEHVFRPYSREDAGDRLSTPTKA